MTSNLGDINSILINSDKDSLLEGVALNAARE